MKTEKFTVDSALLRELGERLVGKPHVALAELIKNAYDADARVVRVRFSDDRIEVVDNGHGMNYREFRDHWMRIGTPHKQRQRVSRKYKRPLTGSKGVGRLAVQFLAKQLDFSTVAEDAPKTQLDVSVDWEAAVSKGTLTEATARYDANRKPQQEFPEGLNHGMGLILSNLNQPWDSDAIVELAKEIWMLQPPFGTRSLGRERSGTSFRVVIESDDPADVELFELQTKAVLEIWNARLVGQLHRITKRGKDTGAEIRLALQFADGEQHQQRYTIENCKIHNLDFEIRVFHLKYRQPFGVSVPIAREYFNQYGGVHIYDAGFRLPYYGLREADWLELEFDHAHRLSKSQLLPESMQVSEAMNYLPTNSRLYGVVNVNTAGERSTREDSRSGDERILKMAVTRDRLIDNQAFRDLHDIIRWAIDYYALEEAKRVSRAAESKRPQEPSSAKLVRVDEVLDAHEPEIPKAVFNQLKREVKQAVQASEAEEQFRETQVGLLGAMATAGMTALAFEHELNREMQSLQIVIGQFDSLDPNDRAFRQKWDAVRTALGDWAKRIKSTRRVFAWLMNQENREEERRYKVKVIVEDVKAQLAIFAKHVDINTSEISPDLRFPMGTYAEWSALFQNVIVNAINATIDCDDRRITISHRQRRNYEELLVQDSGVGVDLDDADDLFEPFVRRLEISPDRRSMGMGGTGLGLAIVRMIAENAGCRADFVTPDTGYSTAFRLSWKS